MQGRGAQGVLGLALPSHVPRDLAPSLRARQQLGMAGPPPLQGLGKGRGVPEGLVSWQRLLLGSFLPRTQQLA